MFEKLFRLAVERGQYWQFLIQLLALSLGKTQRDSPLTVSQRRYVAIEYQWRESEVNITLEYSLLRNDNTIQPKRRSRNDKLTIFCNDC